jgi:hypothetical protein
MAQLEKHAKARVISPSAVRKYQYDHLHWDTMEKNRIACDLKARYLLWVTLTEYSVHEPGEMNLHQGRIRGDVKLYDSTQPEGQNLVWQSPGRLEAVYPETPRYLPHHLRLIMEKTESDFASKLARNFYDHKVSLDDNEPSSL